MKNGELEKIRHSAAHLLAHAIQELYPTTKLTLGPPTAEGFFYDLLPETNFKEADLPAIESRMHEIAKRDLPITHRQVAKDDARKIYKDNPFKLELIDLIPGDTVGLAQQGDFIDLCKGGHVKSTGDIKHFKLLNLSGSYWRADKSNQALQRIAGTAFITKKDLDTYLENREAAQKYDHRKVGKQLELFTLHEAGPGFPFFLPKGTIVLQKLQSFLKNKLDHLGYQEIKTPIMLSDELWRQSGHYTHYKDNMYFSEIDERQFAIRPMNCPGAILLYKERPRSYRELPLKLAEFGLVHRYELSGVLHGLFRARSFTIDDAHIFCTPDQIQEVIKETIILTYDVLSAFGFKDIKTYVSTKPENAMGSDDLWQKGTDALIDGLKVEKIPFEIQEGEGAFYGPKIEFHIEDALGRTWQCGTIQVDFFQSENFDLSYISPEGTKERPVVIHRAIYGSFERFFGILLEHYKGKLPFWLAPEQIRILTITDEQKPYAIELMQKLKQACLRVSIDESSDPISGKIKTAQIAAVPWMLVIGKKEVDNNTVTLRTREGKQTFGLSVDDVLGQAKEQTPE